MIFAQPAHNVDPARHPAQNHPPAKKPDIVSFHVETEGRGALHIIYSDGSEEEIPRERGRFSDSEGILTQETFSDVRLADDHQNIGWLADYMICAQSYPCSAELVIYRSGSKMKHITPQYGIIWGWKFLKGGKQIVVQSGFTHGDETGSYALYDTETVRQLDEFSSKKKKIPNWVQQLQRTER